VLLRRLIFLRAQGLRAVLKLDIPFLEFQSYLGLPKLGVKGQEEGAVDYMVRSQPIARSIGVHLGLIFVVDVLYVACVYRTSWIATAFICV